MSSPTRRWLAGLALVSLGWLASPGAIPVYDGVDFPDEPYRYAGKQPGAAGAAVTVPLTQGRSAPVQLKTVEQGPQVIVDLAAGALAGPGPTVTLTATPLRGDGAPPRGELDGNVYRITAGKGVTVRPETQGFVFLRAAVMTRPNPVIVYRASPSEAWREQKTTRVGTDNLSTPFRMLGDFAVVRLPGSTPLGEEGGFSQIRLMLLSGGILLLLVITVLVLRRPRPGEDEDEV